MSYISSNAPSSPSKFCRVNGSAATLARTKDDARAELRTMAHKKVYVSDVNSFFNNFSGQIAYESWTLSLYNVVFTVLPPLVIGIFDQFVSARILDRYPQLYMLGQKNAFFTKTQFWLWVGNALYHSLVRSFSGSPS